MVAEVARRGGMTKDQTEEKSRRRTKGGWHDWERGTWPGPVSGSCRLWRREGGLWRRLGKAGSCGSDQVCPEEGSTLGKWLSLKTPMVSEVP